MARIGIYSGTFNPPHAGHILGAQYAQKELDLEKILVIPDKLSPHKRLPGNSADYGQRLEMVRLAVADTPGLTACDILADSQGASYSYETVEAVRRMYPNDTLVFLMGTDMFLCFHQWKEPKRILANAQLAVLCRDPAAKDLAEQKRVLEAMGATVTLLSNPVTDISSTMLRRMLPLRCPGEFLAEPVKYYIYQNGLYGTDIPLKNLPQEQLRQVVEGLLKPNRVRHVMGCADTCVELAKRWGADETDACRAGLLHDITKAMDGPLQLTLCREYGIILDAFSSQNPKTLHALTGSYAAQRIFGENDAVVSAIRSHTTGKADMNLLEKIVYVADYMEPNRDFPGVEELRRLAFSDIDKALKLGLTMTLDMLSKQQRQISPESISALRWLEEHGI